MQLLDKVMSDNLQKSFFADAGIPLERDTERADGKVRVDQKGSIQLLDEWLRTRFQGADDARILECVAAFREVRQLRQKPSHAVDEDVFDSNYYARQRELVIRAYRAMKIVRLLCRHRSPRAPFPPVSPVPGPRVT